MLVRVFDAQFCARDRGCGAHPVFPAPSLLKRANEMQNSGRIAPRECERIFNRRPGLEPGPIRRGGDCLLRWSMTFFQQRTPVVISPCSRPGRQHHTCSAIEYFTWLSAKVDSIA